MNKLLNALVGYSPERDGRKQVHVTDKKTKKRTQPKGQLMPSNVKPNLTTGWLELHKEINGIPHWSNLNASPNIKTDSLNRSPILKESEIEYLETTYGVLLNKGEELKVWWAAGDSIQECSDRFKGKWGYGYNTIKKYWALFNKTSSPL